MAPTASDGDQHGLVVGADQEDRPVLTLDVDLGQVAAAEALGRPLAEGEQGGAHGGDPVLVHAGGQRRGHGQAVEGHDRGSLELWGLARAGRQHLVELDRSVLRHR